MILKKGDRVRVITEPINNYARTNLGDTGEVIQLDGQEPYIFVKLDKGISQYIYTEDLELIEKDIVVTSKQNNKPEEVKKWFEIGDKVIYKKEQVEIIGRRVVSTTTKDLVNSQLHFCIFYKESPLWVYDDELSRIEDLIDEEIEKSFDTLMKTLSKTERKEVKEIFKKLADKI